MRACVPLACLAWLCCLAGAPAQNVVPGENLVLDGVPPIPTAVAERVARYTEYRAAGQADWHPHRQEMLVLTRFADTNQVHHVAAPGAARSQLTFSRDAVSGASYEPAEGQYVVFSRSVGGNERYQLYRLDLDTGAVTLLTDGESRNSAGRWAHGGGLLAYTSTRRTGADTDVYVIDPANPKSDRLVLERKGGGWGVLDWSPDDGQLLLAEYVSINESHLHLLDVETRAVRRLTPAPGKEPVAYGNARFGKDGQTLYLTTDRDAEFQYLAALDLPTGQLTPLARPRGDVESFDLSADGQTIAYTVNDAGVGKLFLFDVAGGQSREPRGLPAGSVYDARWHKREPVLAFQVVSASSPADVYSLDRDGGAVSRWTRSETGGLVTRGFREPRLVTWKSFDGRPITGFLYAPPARFKGKRPVVIDIHGGPESQFRPIYLGRKNYWVQEMGVALLCPNVRGSAGFGKTFLKLDNGLQREGSYRDIGALLDWVARQPDLDPDRVMVTGGSYGGFMTLAVACNYPEKIRCAVDVVGISNFNTFLQNTESYRRDLRRAEYGDERDPEMRAFLERIAPLNKVAKMTRPMFIVQGLNDPRVPASEAEQMVAALKKQGTPVWYLLARDEGHGFAKKSNADFQFYATVRFMEEYLLK